MTNPVMSPEDFLEHYGVKGMRWGHRKRSSEIHRARGVVKRAKKDLHKQEERVLAEKSGTKARANAEKKLETMRVDFLNNPDRATSARMTVGEAIVLSLFTTPVVGVGAALGTRARSMDITSRQFAGDYKKK